MSDTNQMPTARPCTIVLRGLDGEFTEQVLVFRAGFSVGPFSLGRHGDWRVRADGVANLHVYLWFDGLTLHAARLRGGPEAWINGEPLREDWSPLPDGAELRVGAAKVMISTNDTLPAESARAGSTTSAAPDESASAPATAGRRAFPRMGRFNWRVLLITFCVPAIVLLWLALTSSAHPRREPAPTRSTGSAPNVGSLATPPTASDSSQAARPSASDREPAAAPSASSAEAIPSSPNIQRLEQQAADATLRGDFQAATELYEKLSSLVPNSRAFEVAKRVAARKAELTASRK
jgi:hypothetical protein